MDPKRLFWFILTSSALLILIDVYVVASWNRYVRRMQWNVWWRRAAWILVLVMAILSPTVNFMRSNQWQLDGWLYAVFLVTTFWYLPKLPIFLFLLGKDIVRFFAGVWNRFGRGKSFKKAEVALEGRRAVIQTSAWTLASVPFFMVTKGLMDVDNITIFRQDVDFAHLGAAFEGIRIAQISDIHAGSWRDSRPFQETRRLLEIEKPDVLLITGDFVNFQPDELRLIRSDLEKLNAEMGVFASLGNHDHYMKPEDHALLKSVIKNCGINLLVNENHSLQINNDKLQLVAIDNTGLGQNYGDLPTAMVGVTDRHPVILMAHDPTFWDREVRRKTYIDLMLSGHTHGGQVAVHIMGQDLSVAQLAYKQWAGLYHDQNQRLYVNRGLGTIGPPIRIGVPPEITMLTLRQRKPLLG